MTDDEIRALLERAHGADEPPPMARLLARPQPAPRAWPALALAAAVAVALAALLLRPSPPRPQVALAPLDFLLDVPGTTLLRDVPRFDMKGVLP